MLDARQVGEEAERVVLSLAGTCREGFESFFAYLAVDEPVIHLMPLHFLPAQPQHPVSRDSLQELAVAAKLEYARNRWLDGMVDGDAAAALSTHRLNGEILDLIHSRYAGVLDGHVAASFFATLARLHARYCMAVILDGASSGQSAPPITLEEYVEHAEARHGPVRAAVDAVLLLAGATDDERERARLSWHRWALGVQFYDDALDVEEDYLNGGLSWALSRTFEHLEGRLPEPDAFYETALREGVVSEALAHAESFFSESERLAEPLFASWAAFQRECLMRARTLREDYEKLVEEHG